LDTKHVLYSMHLDTGCPNKHGTTSISSLFHAGYFVNIIILVSQLKHLTPKTNKSLDFQNVVDLFLPQKRRRYWEIFPDSSSLKLNKTVQMSLNSHVYWDTLYERFNRGGHY